MKNKKPDQPAGLFLNLLTPMIPVLLLQASTAPQSTPYALYATLTAGVLSLIASGLNIYFSSKTAQKVAALSTETTKAAAQLSAQVSREVASLAAETARDLKAEEYKNDFNKKIIEKRLNAWTDAEQFLLPLRASVTKYNESGGGSFKFFRNQDSFNKTLDTFNKYLISQMFWLSGPYATALVAFRNKLNEINNQCLIIDQLNDDGSNILNEKKLLETGVLEHETLNKLYVEMVFQLAVLISNLYDIDDFLERKKNGI